MNARPQLRRGRLCQLRGLDHQRPRLRVLQKMDPPRTQPEAPIAAWCGLGFVVTLLVALVAKACS